MLQKNFPARKLRRKLVADGQDPNTDENQEVLSTAHDVQSKKARAGKRRKNAG